MRCGILHGAFFRMATAFGDPYAIIPLFLAGFTGSRLLIGLIVSLVEAVGILPQLAVARTLQRRPNIAKPLMLTGIWTRCAVWGLIAATALLLPQGSLWIPFLFVGLIIIYSLGGGLAVLPFQKVISETIPPKHRSSFFGGRLASGGLLAVLAGFVVKQVLGNESLAWPRNYGILFLCSFAALILAYTAMSRVQFLKTEETVPRSVPPFRKEIQRMLRDYPVLKRLIAVHIFSGGLVLVLPFLTLYATRDLGLPLKWVGFFIVAQTTGAILSNLAWIPLGNRIGTRSVISSGLGMAALGLSLILIAKNGPALLPAFLLCGGAASALIVGFKGYILELGTPENRPLLFALESTLLMPLRFMPLLGGLLADLFGTRPLIYIGIALLLGGLISVHRLCEPRTGDPVCGPSKLRNGFSHKERKKVARNLRARPKAWKILKDLEDPKQEYVKPRLTNRVEATLEEENQYSNT